MLTATLRARITFKFYKRYAGLQNFLILEPVNRSKSADRRQVELVLMAKLWCLKLAEIRCFSLVSPSAVL